MWSRRHLIAALGAAPAVAVLAGCGFRPVYGRTSYDPNVSEELATVGVSSIPDRAGQLVRNALVARLNPTGEPSRPRYRLNVSVVSTEGQEALQTDQTATRAIDFYTVAFALYDKKGTRIAAGGFNRQLSYDYVEQYYANVSAKDDLDRRAAEQIAEQIAVEVASYFERAAKARAKAQAAGSK